jgi:transposase
MAAPPLVVGVEVANAPLEMALRPTGDRWAVANEDAGMATLVARLQAVPPPLLVFDAPGG